MENIDKVIANPAGAPYAKLRGWMGALGGKAKLPKEDLTTLALLFELSHPDGDDSARIDMEYLCECTGLDTSGAFESIQRLMRKKLATFNMAGGTGDFLSNFSVDDAGIERELRKLLEEENGASAKAKAVKD